MKVKVGKKVKLGSNEYCIIEEIDGKGANSKVWKAENIGKTEVYAIKVLKNGKNPEKLSRFEKECNFCKNNSHKHIIKVFDYIIEEENAYCVMPFYPKTLRTIINVENDAFVLFNYIIQLCEAVQFIHNHPEHIIHRDLKPENILVDEDNTLILTDFGIAHFDASIETTQREWLGNRRYAAPEQLATDEVTTACDIYALGRIMNELFTKQNPSGEAFLTISDKTPLFSQLDSIVQKCRIQDSNLRPSIDEILAELYLLEGELKEKIEEIKETISPLDETEYNSQDEEMIVNKAVKDIILAQHIFIEFSAERLEELNLNYHSNILYDMDILIQNLFFQSLVLDFCTNKFNYESQGYVDKGVYIPLNLDKEDEIILYEELNSILDNYKIPYEYSNITSRIRKYFCSCCKYHCDELLSDIKELCNKESQIVKAPILYIVYLLRKYLDKRYINEIVLSDNISICWRDYPSIECDNEDNEEYLISLDQEEIKILNVLVEKYDAFYSKADNSHYYVRFRTVDEFNKFKTYALELSRPYYIFEGDVMAILHIRREFNGVVELNMLNSFDVTSTLAKILGLREDY